MQSAQRTASREEVIPSFRHGCSTYSVMVLSLFVPERELLLLVVAVWKALDLARRRKTKHAKLSRRTSTAFSKQVKLFGCTVPQRLRVLEHIHSPYT